MKKMFLVLLAVAAVAYSMMDTTEYKMVEKKHTVSQGQTVWGIATKYIDQQDKVKDLNEWVYIIRKVNHLEGQKLRNMQPGDVLTIPLEVKEAI